MLWKRPSQFPLEGTRLVGRLPEPCQGNYQAAVNTNLTRFTPLAMNVIRNAFPEFGKN